MVHTALLFIHVASAMAMFTSLGMEAVALAQLRRATDDPAIRVSLASFGSSQRVGGFGSLLLLLSGITLATAYWHWQGAWMGLGFIGLVATGAVGGAMTGRSVKRLRQAIGSGAAGASPLTVLPVLRRSFIVRFALLTGVIYLMTAKPEPPIALGALVAAAVIGLVLGRGGAYTAVPRTAGASQ